MNEKLHLFCCVTGNNLNTILKEMFLKLTYTFHTIFVKTALFDLKKKISSNHQEHYTHVYDTYNYTKGVFCFVFVTTSSNLRDRVGNSGTKVQDNIFPLSHCGESARVIILGHLPPVEFSVMWGGAKSWAITVSVSPQGATEN